jgi:hypothetical protein
MTDPTPPTPEALAAALRLVLLAADYAASDRYYTQGYRPDGAAEPEKLRGLIALVEDNLPAMATGPSLAREVELLREVAREARRLRAIGDSASTVGWEQGRVLDAALAKLAALDAGETEE